MTVLLSSPIVWMFIFILGATVFVSICLAIGWMAYKTIYEGSPSFSEDFITLFFHGFFILVTFMILAIIIIAIGLILWQGAVALASNFAR